MAAAVRLREDFDGPRLRALARRTRDAGQLRRLLAVAEIYDGRSRGEAARIGGVGLQTVHDWVLRFNARGPDGLIDAKHPGPRPKLNAEQRAALGRLVEDGPQPAIDGVVPDNITLLLLPPKSPELNPVENTWQFIRDNWLSNRVFTSYRDILDHCCYAWNSLIEQPWVIMSIGLRKWAHQ